MSAKGRRDAKLRTKPDSFSIGPWLGKRLQPSLIQMRNSFNLPRMMRRIALLVTAGFLLASCAGFKITESTLPDPRPKYLGPIDCYTTADSLPGLGSWSESDW